MKPPFLVFVVSLAIIAPCVRVHAQQRTTPKPPAEEKAALGEYVSFPSSGIKMRQPAGFVRSDSFDGFGQSGTQVTIMAVSVAAPYSKMSEAFTAEPLKARGFTFLGREEVKVDGLPGILIHFEQPSSGGPFSKWVLGFGDEQRTRMVTASFPKERERELSAQLKSAVLSTRADGSAPPAPGADLPYTIEASAKLKITPGISKAAFYTKDGVVPAKSPKDPIFIVAPSIGQVPVADKRQMAERSFRDTSHTKAFTLTSTDPITIAGLSGYESLATGEEDKSGTPLFFYQVILFDGDNYVRMVGMVGTELRDEYLPEFKAMARSLRKK